jgi:PIN domain nuclease of toxin-antitoxin system
VKLLLDTHAFLWWVTDDDRLSQNARKRIAEPRNEVFLSAVSAWEIVVKASLGRLSLVERPDRFVMRQLEANAFTPMPLQLSHAANVWTLPDHHKDPFDRLLVAQALVEGLSLVTGDRKVGRYPVKIVW